MAQRVDQRAPKSVQLDVYDKCLKLSDHVMSVCKPKDKNVNNKHIPKRNLGLGKQLQEACVEMGADILEANTIYVGANIAVNKRSENYEKRIRLQEHARRLTFRMEHIFRILHFDAPFAESTSKYMMDLLCETRDLLERWHERDMNDARKLRKGV